MSASATASSPRSARRRRAADHEPSTRPGSRARRSCSAPARRAPRCSAGRCGRRLRPRRARAGTGRPRRPPDPQPRDLLPGEPLLRQLLRLRAGGAAPRLRPAARLLPARCGRRPRTRCSTGPRCAAPTPATRGPRRTSSTAAGGWTASSRARATPRSASTPRPSCRSTTRCSTLPTPRCARTTSARSSARARPTTST